MTAQVRERSLDVTRIRKERLRWALLGSLSSYSQSYCSRYQKRKGGGVDTEARTKVNEDFLPPFLVFLHNIRIDFSLFSFKFWSITPIFAGPPAATFLTEWNLWPSLERLSRVQETLLLTKYLCYNQLTVFDLCFDYFLMFHNFSIWLHLLKVFYTVCGCAYGPARHSKIHLYYSQTSKQFLRHCRFYQMVWRAYDIIFRYHFPLLLCWAIIVVGYSLIYSIISFSDHSSSSSLSWERVLCSQHWTWTLIFLHSLTECWDHRYEPSCSRLFIYSRQIVHLWHTRYISKFFDKV